jgi:hypothetical protein
VGRTYVCSHGSMDHKVSILQAARFH